ncbi:alpha/beta hydrolase [Subtercola boreus]|uniref:Alpha/beta hydrolase n=1 Tax=Subtercola boreus TaxID=120213 RepID=A0A3E0W2D0_9MICO|nr:alpha/beta hydrolase [Subtercola boreus]RFA16316.1 alpha/beta hydrolase [Subtercola boreus]
MGSSPLYSEMLGSGEPLLLLHGGFASLEPLRPLAVALSADFEVHMYERPGHGRTPDRPGPYSYDEMVLDALAFLDASGVGAAHVVGFSDGANIALMLALGHPSRVLSLTAISGNLDPGGFIGTVAEVDPEEEPPDWQGAERDDYDALSPDGPGHARTVIGKLRWLWVTEPHIPPSALSVVTAPTLVISGDRDTIRVDHSALIAASIPGAELCIVPGSTHGIIEERLDFVTFVVRDFLGSPVASSGHVR